MNDEDVFQPDAPGEFDHSFDYENYLAVLEPYRTELLGPIPEDPYPVRRWRWPDPLPYNGFTPIERIKFWQRVCWAEANGALLPCTKICSVCGSAQGVIGHAENYYDLTAAIPLCRACHFTVHTRFRQPSGWRRFQQRYAPSRGDKPWFCHLPYWQIDLAGYIRRNGD